MKMVTGCLRRACFGSLLEGGGERGGPPSPHPPLPQDNLVLVWVMPCVCNAFRVYRVSCAPRIMCDAFRVHRGLCVPPWCVHRLSGAPRLLHR